MILTSINKTKHMKLQAGVLLIFILLFIGCEKDDISECQVEDPIEELSWLKELVNSNSACSCQITTFQGKYKDHTVYYQLMNDPVCNSVFGTILFDCKGQLIKQYFANDQERFVQEVTHEKTVHICSDEN